jgi:spermidine synthase
VLGPVTPIEPETVGRAESSAGEVLLRTRGTVTELIVGGVFVMDTVDVSTEVELARAALAGHRRPARVLVGGLGLGFTAAAVLADSRVGEVRVVEIAEPLSRWAEEGLLPAPGLADERLTVEVGDVRTVLEATAGAWDVVLLDVDNGPGFLVRPENTDLYAPAGLRRAVAALAPGGVLAIWSSHRADDLSAALRAIPGGRVEEVLRTVHREGREFDYAIYLLTTADPEQTDLAAYRIPE